MRHEHPCNSTDYGFSEPPPRGAMGLMQFRGGVRFKRADGIRAMPSARALLVASLLTEPPYGCLGPSGNDRYRKRSLRSQTVGLRKSTAKSRRLFRNESATSRRVRAGAIGGSNAMTRTAFCRKSPRVPRVCWLGSWALGSGDRGGQDKSRKVRPVGRRRNSVKHRLASNIANDSCNLRFLATCRHRSALVTLRRAR
jgi:hypothetical protein